MIDEPIYTTSKTIHNHENDIHTGKGTHISILYLLLTRCSVLYTSVVRSDCVPTSADYPALDCTTNTIHSVVRMVLIPKYYKSMEYIITDKEIIWKRRVWFKNTTHIHFNRITDFHITQGPVARKLKTNGKTKGCRSV